MQVIFAVADAERAAAFYEAAFGWPRNSAIDYRNYVEPLVDGGALGLYERAGYGDEVGAEPVASRGRRRRRCAARGGWCPAA